MRSWAEARRVAQRGCLEARLLAPLDRVGVEVCERRVDGVLFVGGVARLGVLVPVGEHGVDDGVMQPVRALAPAGARRCCWQGLCVRVRWVERVV